MAHKASPEDINSTERTSCGRRRADGHLHRAKYFKVPATRQKRLEQLTVFL
jgi:hypothetical protein